MALAVGDTVFKVQVTAEDTTTTQTYTVTVTRAAADTPTVTIAADQPAFTGRLDWVTFTLTRTGNAAAALDVAVALTQDRNLLESEDLAQTVMFGAGDATAALILFPFVSFQTVTQETTLTATVQAGSGYAPGSPNTASTRIVAADPAVTASIEEGRLHVRRGRHRGRHPPHRDRRAVAQYGHPRRPQHRGNPRTGGEQRRLHGFLAVPHISNHPTSRRTAPPSPPARK